MRYGDGRNVLFVARIGSPATAFARAAMGRAASSESSTCAKGCV